MSKIYYYKYANLTIIFFFNWHYYILFIIFFQALSLMWIKVIIMTLLWSTSVHKTIYFQFFCQLLLIPSLVQLLFIQGVGGLPFLFFSLGIPFHLSNSFYMVVPTQSSTLNCNDFFLLYSSLYFNIIYSVDRGNSNTHHQRST